MQHIFFGQSRYRTPCDETRREISKRIEGSLRRTARNSFLAALLPPSRIQSFRPLQLQGPRHFAALQFAGIPENI